MEPFALPDVKLATHLQIFCTCHPSGDAYLCDPACIDRQVRSFKLVIWTSRRVTGVLIAASPPGIPAVRAAAGLVGGNVVPQIPIQAHLLHFVRRQDPNALHTVDKFPAL